MQIIFGAPMHLFLAGQKDKIMKNKALCMLLMIVSTQAFAKEWAFDVYLDKSKIGQHTFKLEQNNQLTSRAKFSVKVLFINAYSYDHTAKEQWQDDCLSGLEANTIEDKVVTDIYGTKKDSKFEISDGKVSQNLPECVMTFAYWNPKILTETKLLNPQNAQYLDTKFEKLGTKTISVKGKPTEAQHYKLNGSLNGKSKLNIELWYADNKDWVALKSTTPEGYEVKYKLK
jgi:Family of unknown function (DUF6134)